MTIEATLAGQPPPLPPEQAQNLAATLCPTEDEKTSAMLCHLLGIFTGFIGPLVMWSMKKAESRFVDWHGREALNFSLSLLIYYLVGAVVMTVIAVATCGLGSILFPVLGVLPVFGLVAHIMALTKAKRGELHRYPMTIRLIAPPPEMDAAGNVFAHSLANAATAPVDGRAAGSQRPVWAWIAAGVGAVVLLGCGGVVGGYYLIRDAIDKRLAKQNEFALMQLQGDGNKNDNLVFKQNIPVVEARTTVPDFNNIIIPEAIPARPKFADPVRQAIEDLQSEDPMERGRAADTLAKARTVVNLRPKAAKALEKQLHDSEEYPRRAAARALPVWATKDSVPALIELLGVTTSPLDKQKIMSTLGDFKDERAIPALIEEMKHLGARKNAADALKKIGPNAEDNVIQLLYESDVFVKKAACDLLKDMGTKKSIVPLTNLLRDRNASVSRAARDAVTAVKARYP